MITCEFLKSSKILKNCTDNVSLYFNYAGRDMHKKVISRIVLYFIYPDQKTWKMAEMMSFESKGMENIENRKEEKSY